MSVLIIFGIICLLFGAGIFAAAVYISANSNKEDDEKFKESIGHLCSGAIVGAILFCGVFAIAIQENCKQTTDEGCCCQTANCCQTECCESDSTMVNNE